MLDPSIDSLQKQIRSKYSLATIAAKRARDLKDVSEPLIEEPSSKTLVGVALEEINEGKLYIKKE